jgi:hypothetical protein
MNAHVVYDINIWEPNLRKKWKSYWSEDPHPTRYELNLEDEILVRGVHVTYRKFEWFTMCDFSQKFKTFCVNMWATKFDPNLLASHLKFLIK